MELLYGVHPVEEAIRSAARPLDAVLVSRERKDDRLDRLVALARASNIPIRLESRDQLTRLAKTDQHQGVLALVRPREFLSVEDLLRAPADGYRFFLALDGIEDPHNLGALLRTADAAGVNGVILPERRSAPVTGTVAKVSAGASEHVPIARVTNLVRALEVMKKNNIWVIGLDERGTSDYMDFDFRSDCVLVLGREGAGLHDLVKKTCDHLLRIPMAGMVSSLNVSVAGAVVMYESVRQRRAAPPPTAPVARKKLKGLGS